MDVFFKQTFIRDFKDLPEEIKRIARKICLEIFPKLKDLKDLKEYKIKPVKGFNRKDIYRYFP